MLFNGQIANRIHAEMHKEFFEFLIWRPFCDEVKRYFYLSAADQNENTYI